jgi:DNA (cytosine-5)-methyltransferase 1
VKSSTRARSGLNGASPGRSGGSSPDLQRSSQRLTASLPSAAPFVIYGCGMYAGFATGEADEQVTIESHRAARKVKALDFFCGAGGLTRGLLDAGIEVLAGIDNDERLRRTYEHNNAPSRFLAEDVRKFDIQKTRRELEISDDDLVLYAACTPCQPFSTLNQRRGKDDRKELLIAFGELVEAAPPDFIIVENVPGLHNAYGREIYTEFLAQLTRTGIIDRDAAKLDAAEYEVPQVRKRFIMVASRRGSIKLPVKSESRQRTVRDAIGNLPPPQIGIEGAQSSRAESAMATLLPYPDLPNHVTRKLLDKHLKIVQKVPRDGGSRQDITDYSVLLECHKKNPTLHKDVFGRMRWDAPAPTMTCRCTDTYCGRFVHPEEDRGLSLREAAAIQSFPPWYEFFGTFLHASAQIGNAVPVLLAKQLGRQVVEAAQAL